MIIVPKGVEGVIDQLHTQYPSIIYANHEEVEIPSHATGYGYVLDGVVFVDDIVVPAGYAFSALHSVRGGSTVVVVRYGYRGMSVITKLEETGRVQYIDGCTDTLMIAPARKGDSCLNSLHFPPKIEQSWHTHPSIRGGVVAWGRGKACTPDGHTPIEQGDAWLIETGEVHRFTTDEEGMIVIAFHPDSDWGPTDEVHPMINRTYIT